jgi:hypothetical protein
MSGDKDTPKPPKPIGGLDPNEATSRAAKFMGQVHKSRKCQQYAEESILGHGGVYGSAKEYYNWATGQKSIQTSAPPAGVPVFYAGSSKNNYGHVGVSAGGGYVYSTDVNGNRVGKVKYNELWGGKGSGQYLGWTGAIQTSKGGKTTNINYDPKSVGKAPTVKVPTSTGVKSDKNRGSIFNAGAIGSAIGKALNLPGSNSTPSSSVAETPKIVDSNTIGSTNRVISR